MKNSLKNKWQSAMARNRQALSTRTAKVGGYSFVLSLVVLAILIAVNVLASKLPSSWTQFDISAAQLYAMTTYDKEDGDTDGPFTLAVSIEDAAAGGRLIWVASDYLVDDTYNSYSSGANLDFLMNGLSWMIGETDAVSIPSKSLNYNYLTISSSSAAWLKVCMIGIIPVGFLLLGVDEVLRRRKKV